MDDLEMLEPVESTWQWEVPIPEGAPVVDAGAVTEWLRANGHPDASVAVDELARVAYVNAKSDPTEAIAVFDGQPRSEERQGKLVRLRLAATIQKVDSGQALTSAERDRVLRDIAGVLLRLTQES